jgi:Spy/CpxP family protein refolding chaperone
MEVTMTRTHALVGLTALALVGTAAVQAQPTRQGPPDQRPRIEQRMQGQGAMRGPGFRQGPGHPGGRGMALRGLDLTEDQKAQIKAIHDKVRQDVEAVLTPEQREQLTARRAGRGGRGGGGEYPAP